MVSRYMRMKSLLWNYPGQAFTSFLNNTKTDNKYHSNRLSKLLDHLEDNKEGKFRANQRFFMLAHQSSASTATHFAATQRLASLKGIVLVNELSHVNFHYASVFHNYRNMDSCSPESRPNLPVYFYAQFLFSSSYLSKTSSSLVLNVYTVVHNPITLNERKHRLRHLRSLECAATVVVVVQGNGELNQFLLDLEPLLAELRRACEALSLVQSFHTQSLSSPLAAELRITPVPSNNAIVPIVVTARSSLPGRRCCFVWFAVICSFI